MTAIIIEISIVLLIFVSTVYCASLFLKRNDIADIAWGGGFLVVCLYVIATKPIHAVTACLLVMMILWAVRLMVHIASRHHGKPEDARYAAWRMAWMAKGIRYFRVRSYLQVFLLQGAMMLLVMMPLLVSNSSLTQSVSFLGVLGILLWCVGFFFESAGDYQLKQFIGKRKNKGKIMTQGLWRYTRHPNYFGEVTMWWGIFLLAVQLPYGWVAIISPLTITYLLLYVSGIPMTEARYADHAEFQAYAKRTNAFFPWWPKVDK